MKIIYEKDAIDALHKTMLEFFKTNSNDEPEFITASEKMLLSVNKAISNALKELPSAQSELEDKIRAIGYTGKEGRIYIGGRLFAVRELPQ